MEKPTPQTPVESPPRRSLHESTPRRSLRPSSPPEVADEISAEIAGRDDEEKGKKQNESLTHSLSLV